MMSMSMNFWDFSGTTPQQDPESESTPTSSPPESPAEDAGIVAEPSRDEMIDFSRGDQEGESREEDKTATCRQNQLDEHPTNGDVSMFSTLTELLFNPFLDGYCKTPFCSDGDYLPPTCPSSGFYTVPDHHQQQYPLPGSGERTKPQQDETCIDYGDICRSNSGASSAVSCQSKNRRRRQRPLAFAVGHGDEWKDPEGRRVVITPSSSRRAQQAMITPTRLSPYGYRAPPAACTCHCATPESPSSLLLSENQNNHNISPHQTKAVICKACRLQDLELPPSRSSGTISTHPPAPPLM